MAALQKEFSGKARLLAAAQAEVARLKASLQVSDSTQIHHREEKGLRKTPVATCVIHPATFLVERNAVLPPLPSCGGDEEESSPPCPTFLSTTIPLSLDTILFDGKPA